VRDLWSGGVLLNVRIGLNDNELKEILQSWNIAPKIPPAFAEAVWARIAERERLRRSIPVDAVSPGSAANFHLESRRKRRHR
jgi:hypothetical protein